MVRQSYLLMTRRQEVNEIVEFLFSPQNTLYCISEKLAHTEVILPRALKKKKQTQKNEQKQPLMEVQLYLPLLLCQADTEIPIRVFKGTEEIGLWGRVARCGAREQILLLLSLHFICNDGSKTERQQLLPLFHYLALYIKSHVGSCQLFTSLFNSSWAFLIKG